MAARSYHVVFSFLFECVARSFRRWIHFLQRFNTWTLARLLSVWFLFTARRARSRPVSKQLESDLRSRLRLFSFSFFRRPLSFTHMRILSASRGVLKYAMRTSEECNRNSNNQTRFARRGFWMWNWKTRVCNCGIVVVSQPQTHCPVRFAGVFNSQTKYILRNVFVYVFFHGHDCHKFRKFIFDFDRLQLRQKQIETGFIAFRMIAVISLELNSILFFSFHEWEMLS